MISEEEFPESFEELERELEEIEKGEIIPPEEIPKKMRPKVPVEAKFRVSSVFVGFVVAIAVLLGVNFYVINDIGRASIVSLFLGPVYPNILLESLTGFSIGSYTPLVDLAKENTIDPFMNVYENITIIFVIIGLLPYLLAGIIAGAINRDPIYGLTAGFVIWLLNFIIGAIFIVVLANVLESMEVSVNVGEMLLGYFQTCYLSAVFLVVFGALGGATRKP